MRYFLTAVLVCLAFGTGLGSPAAARDVARVIDAEGGAILRSGRRDRPVVEGMMVAEKDEVRTGDSGRVLLLFADETRVAIGPRSQFQVNSIVMKDKSRASRFRVSTLGGNFRFLSGKSPKEAYEIRTPTATMGIRGTVFDVSAYPQVGARVAIFEGEVLLCPNGGRCGLVRGRCTLALSDRQGRIGLSESKRQKKQILANQFPFIVNQRPLPKEYRTRTSSCGNLKPLIPKAAPIVLEVVPIAPPEPPPPPPPPEPPSPEPPRPEPPAPEPSKEFPGQSGSETPNVGKGNEVSQGQSGTGRGKGQGAQKRNTDNRGAFSNRRK